MRKIVTSPTHSPLPYRHYDWCAYFEGEEEAGGYGYGATPEEAVADFIDNHADDPDLEARITAPAKTIAESVNLLDATMSMLRKSAVALAITAANVSFDDAARAAVEGGKLELGEVA